MAGSGADRPASRRRERDADRDLDRHADKDANSNVRRPPEPSPEGGDPEERREELLGDYLRRINAGEKIDRDEIRRLHPEFSEDLIEGLDLLEAIETSPRTAPETSPRTSSELGSLGDFQLRRRVGRGGMGVVYEAWQQSLERRVALKVLPAGAAADPRALARFVREAKVAGQLRHPNIVAVHGMGIESDTPFYAMEFIEGETLAQVLERARAAAGQESVEGLRKGLVSISGCFHAGVDEERSPSVGPVPSGGGANEPSESALRAPPPPSRLGPEDVDLQYCLNLARAFAGAAEGLQHAHARGVIHRDIKPSNLILDRDVKGASSAPFTLRILDFGLARLKGEASLTGSGDFPGTPVYMSPEQAMARRTPVDHRTDIYSLGATLHEMLVLRPPFRGKDHRETISQIISRDPAPLRRANPRIPRDLETIVLKCLRKDPAERYGTGEALVQDLRRFARGDPIEARPQAAWEKLARRAWSLRLRIALGCAIALAATASGILA